jgi:hypothetical protein
MLNFPNNPANAAIFTSPDGSRWQWDTKKWMSIGAASAGSTFLPLVGGTITGDLTVNGTTTLNAAVGVTMAAADNSLNLATTAFVKSQGGPFLPLVGGTLTGRLNISFAGAGRDIVLWNGDVNSAGSYTHIYNDGSTHIGAGNSGHLYLDRTAGHVIVSNSSATYGLWVQSAATGSRLVFYDDGNSHIASTTQIWVDTFTTFQGNVQISGELNIYQPLRMRAASGAVWYEATTNNVYQIYASAGLWRIWTAAYGDALTVNYATGAVYLRGGISLGSTLYFDGRPTLLNDGSYTVITDAAGRADIFLGGSDLKNYYRQSQHNFQSIAGGADFFVINATESICYGILRSNNGRIVSQNANNNPGFCCHWPGNYAAGMFLGGTNLYFGNMGGDGAYAGPPFGYFNSGGRFYPLNGVTIAGDLYVPNGINAGGSTIQTSGTVQGAALAVYGGTFYNGQNDGWCYFNGSLRVWNFISLNDVQAGNVYASGSVFFGGCQLYNNGGWAYFVNAVHVAELYSRTGISCAGNVQAANDVIAPSVFRRGSAGRGGRIECWGTDWDNICFTMSGGNFLFSPDLGGSGYYVTPAPFSDARLKDDIRDTEIDALAAIVATPVRSFRWNKEGIRLQPHINDDEVSIGLVAQEIEQTMPSAVELSPFNDGNLHLRDHNITPYLVRAIQQLVERVAQLESER